MSLILDDNVDRGLDQERVVISEQDLQLAYAEQVLFEIRGKKPDKTTYPHILRAYLSTMAGIRLNTEQFFVRAIQTIPDSMRIGYRQPLRSVVEKARHRLTKNLPEGIICKQGNGLGYDHYINPDHQEKLILEDPTAAVVRAVKKAVQVKYPAVRLTTFDWSLIDLPVSFEVLGRVIDVPSRECLFKTCQAQEMEVFTGVKGEEEEDEEREPEIEATYSREVYEQVLPALFKNSQVTNTNARNLNRKYFDEGSPEYGLQKVAFTLMIEWVKRLAKMERTKDLFAASVPLAMQEVIAARPQPRPEQTLEIIQQIETESIPLLELLLSQAAQYAQETNIEKTFIRPVKPKDPPVLHSQAGASHSQADYRETLRELFPNGTGTRVLRDIGKIQFPQGSRKDVVQRAAQALTDTTTMLASINHMAKRASAYPNAFVCLVARYPNIEALERTIQFIKDEVIPKLKEYTEAVLMPPPLPDRPDKPSYNEYLDQYYERFLPAQFAILKVLAGASDSSTPIRYTKKEIFAQLPEGFDEGSIQRNLGALPIRLNAIGLDIDSGTRAERSPSRGVFRENATYRLVYLDDDDERIFDIKPLPYEEIIQPDGGIKISKRFLRHMYALKLLENGRIAKNSRLTVLLSRFLEEPLDTEVSLASLKEQILTIPKYRSTSRAATLTGTIHHAREDIAQLIPGLSFERQKRGFNDIGFTMSCTENLVMNDEDLMEWFVDVLYEVLAENGYAHNPLEAPLELPSSFSVLGHTYKMPDRETINARLTARVAQAEPPKPPKPAEAPAAPPAKKPSRSRGPRKPRKKARDARVARRGTQRERVVAPKRLCRPDLPITAHCLSPAGIASGKYAYLEGLEFTPLRGAIGDKPYLKTARQFKLHENPQFFVVATKDGHYHLIESFDHIMMAPKQEVTVPVAKMSRAVKVNAGAPLPHAKIAPSIVPSLKRPGLPSGRFVLTPEALASGSYDELDIDGPIVLLEDCAHYDELAYEHGLHQNPAAVLAMNQGSIFCLHSLEHVGHYYDEKLSRPQFTAEWYELSSLGRRKHTFYPRRLRGTRLKVLTGPQDHRGYEARAQKAKLNEYENRVLVVTENDPETIELIIHERDIQEWAPPVQEDMDPDFAEILKSSRQLLQDLAIPAGTDFKPSKGNTLTSTRGEVLGGVGKNSTRY